MLCAGWSKALVSGTELAHGVRPLPGEHSWLVSEVPWQLEWHLHSQQQLQEVQSKFPDRDGTTRE